MSVEQALQGAEDAQPTMSGVAVHRDAVISFPEGMPGFEACHAFVLLSSPEMDPLQQLQAVAGPQASFIGVDPNRLVPGYRCDLSDFDRARLRARDDSVLLWLALIAIEADGTVTANLRAPIVINPETMTGCQVVPHRCAYTLRHVVTDIE